MRGFSAALILLLHIFYVFCMHHACDFLLQIEFSNTLFVFDFGLRIDFLFHYISHSSEQLALNGNLLSRNAVNITITLLAFFMPMIFDALGLFENWHPRQQLRLQLARYGNAYFYLKHTHNKDINARRD